MSTGTIIGFETAHLRVPAGRQLPAAGNEALFAALGADQAAPRDLAEAVAGRYQAGREAAEAPKPAPVAKPEASRTAA